ncbi:MAG: C39 family peptidase [Firmicutes bacterium]|nr:C39 family peptidase [Bacillota bacterium]
MHLRKKSWPLRLGLGLAVVVGLFLIPQQTEGGGFGAMDPKTQTHRGIQQTGQSHPVLLDVPVWGQYPQLPTGCEATAVAMLLTYAGEPVTKEMVALALPRAPLPHEEQGRRVGASPNTAFLGDPWKPDSLGVFHRPVAAVIDRFLPGAALDLTGTPLLEVLQHVAAGEPVMVWTTIDLAEPKVAESWEDPQGKPVVWLSPEHVVVIVGFDAQSIWANDPTTGKRTIYPRALFEKRYDQMGRQAVAIRR